MHSFSRQYKAFHDCAVLAAYNSASDLLDFGLWTDKVGLERKSM